MAINRNEANYCLTGATAACARVLHAESIENEKSMFLRVFFVAGERISPGTSKSNKRRKQQTIYMGARLPISASNLIAAIAERSSQIDSPNFAGRALA